MAQNLVSNLYDQYSEQHSQVEGHNTAVCGCVYTHTCEE